MEVDSVERIELAAFCAREHPRLVGALSLYCGNADVAAEVAQEALIRAVRDWPRVRRMASPGAWVHRTAMNLAASWFRRRAAEKRAYARTGSLHSGDIPDHSDAMTVRQLVAALPDRQRKAIVLRFYLGMSVAEAAGAIGVTDQAVAALTYRAMQDLRAHLQDTALEVAPDVN